MKSDLLPPKKALSFLRWFCKDENLEEVEGDLLEAFELKVSEIGLKKAKIRFWIDVLKSFNPTNIDLFTRLSKALSLPSLGMFSSYFKIMRRSVAKSKMYAGISILSLFMGLTCATLIFLYINKELSFDKFYSDSDRIYRITTDRIGNGAVRHVGFAPMPLPYHLNDNYEAVENMTRIFNYRREVGVTIPETNESFNEANFGWADTTFFEIFDIEFLQGSPLDALKRPFTLVLSETTARRYFGDDNPIGRTVEFNWDNTTEFEVTGVYRDFPTNSHFGFDLMSNVESVNEAMWGGRSWFTRWQTLFTAAYIKVKAGTDVEYLESETDRILDEHWLPEEIELNAVLQPLTDIHLHSNIDVGDFRPKGSITNIYLFGTIGVIILFLGCFNFMNMITAQAGSRSKEIGLRKIFGSKKRQIIQQHYFETTVYVMLSFAIAVVASYFLLPGLSALTGQSYALNDIKPAQWFLTLPAMAVVSLLAGTYPALFISGFSPIRILRGQTMNFKSGGKVRNLFVVTQFVMAIALIIASMVVYLQLEFMKTRDLGFDKDYVINMPIQNDDLMLPRAELFKSEITQHQAVKAANASSHLLFTNYTYVNTFALEGREETLRSERYTVDHDFVNTFNIQIIAGRNFSREYQSDSSALILNETAVKELGLNPQEIIGMKMNNVSAGRAGQVVGVAKDFHFRSLHEKIQPFILQVNMDRLDYFSAKLSGNDLTGGISHIESVWNDLFPTNPFFYEFHDQEFAKLYTSEENQSKLFSWFTTVAIFLGCLGLFGFALFTTEKRVKEIGIRKVLGARSLQITFMLAKDFMIMVMVAYLISLPLSWYLTDQWLSEFAYRINTPYWVFLLAGVGAGAISLITVSYQSLKAAWSNPTQNLKYE